MVFICATCNREFKSLEEMQKHWEDIGIGIKTQKERKST